MTETLINALHPTIQPLCRALLARAAEEGIRLIVTQGVRSQVEQKRLYDMGRTTVGPNPTEQRPLGSIVTKAPPGYSWHEFGLAFDVAVDLGGHPTWPNDMGLWERIGELGEAVGLEWGGRFKSIIDRPHFQHTGGLTLAQAREGKRPNA